MNIKKIAAGASALLLVMSAASCGNNSGDSQPEEGQAVIETIPPTEAPTEPPTEEEIVAAEDGPRLYFTDVTGAPGETVTVDFCVENADLKWNMCGIHVTFSDVLECQMLDEKQNLVDYKRGSASNYSNGSIAMLWTENLPTELMEQHLGCLFFTELFDGDTGGDGEIASFFFKIPEDAESGTVYPIGIYYMDTDMFINAAEDKSLEKYAFENWKGGSITVE